jgi:hypothetical protein
MGATIFPPLGGSQFTKKGTRTRFKPFRLGLFSLTVLEYSGQKNIFKYF